jgi:hypothetical protein
LDSIHPAGIPTLAEAKEVVTDSIRNEKKKGQARAIGQDLLKRIDGGATLRQAADALKLPHQVYGPFSRVSSPIQDPMVTGAAFGLSAGKHSGLIDTKDGFYVLQVLEQTPADSAAFGKDMIQTRVRANQEARQERVQNYVAGLRSTAKIVDNRSKVLQARGQQAS